MRILKQTFFLSLSLWQLKTTTKKVVAASDEGMRHLGFTHDIAVPAPLPPWTGNS